MKGHKLLAWYSYFCKRNVFDGTIKLECIRTTGPLFRTYEPSDYRTFIIESCKSRHRTYEPSDCRTFGMKNPLFRTHEPSDYRTFGLESSHTFRWPDGGYRIGAFILDHFQTDVAKFISKVKKVTDLIAFLLCPPIPLVHFRHPTTLFRYADL